MFVHLNQFKIFFYSSLYNGSSFRDICSGETHFILHNEPDGTLLGKKRMTILTDCSSEKTKLTPGLQARAHQSPKQSFHFASYIKLWYFMLFYIESCFSYKNLLKENLWRQIQLRKAGYFMIFRHIYCHFPLCKTTLSEHVNSYFKFAVFPGF